MTANQRSSCSSRSTALSGSKSSSSEVSRMTSNRPATSSMSSRSTSRASQRSADRVSTAAKYATVLPTLPQVLEFVERRIAFDRQGELLAEADPRGQRGHHLDE